MKKKRAGIHNLLFSGVPDGMKQKIKQLIA